MGSYSSTALRANGVVYIVDAVLVPNAPLASIVNTAVASPQLSSLVGALGKADLVDAVLLPNIPLTTMNIVQTAQSVPDLSSLVGAVVSAGLVNTLSGPGPFTVFAPTNAAFDAISQVVAGLTTQQLVDVLENHVLSGAFQATDLTPGGFLLPLFKGHSLSVDLSKSCAGDGTYCRPCAGSGNFCEVKIMSETVSAMITIGDIKCTNGVVHVVDAVLVPNRLAVV